VGVDPAGGPSSPCSAPAIGQHPRPGPLDVTRTDIHPLTFGGGVHFCLGAALARAEIGITFRTLLRRFDHIELRGEEPRFQDRLTLRGLTALNVECRAASSARPSAAAVTAAVATEVKALAAASELEERGLRPQAGDTSADLRWRAELRQRIESEPARRDSLPVHTGARLAATVGLLLRNRLFERCTQSELEQLAATAYPMSFDPGDLLCGEGDESPECYLIRKARRSSRSGARACGRSASTTSSVSAACC
jgi:hypothetical protein